MLRESSKSCKVLKGTSLPNIPFEMSKVHTRRLVWKEGESSQLHSDHTWVQTFLKSNFTWYHSGVLPQFLFRFETSSVHFMSRKTDTSQEPIDDLASKLINYDKESKEKDQFWCKIINCPLRNISFATHEMNTWCFDAKQKLLKKSTVKCVNLEPPGWLGGRQLHQK